jgi:peptidyl-prolyl cis-trans isomerase SurA
MSPAFLAGVVLALLAADAEPLDRIVAVVDGRPILASELSSASDKDDAIEQLIERQLLQAEARRRDINIDERALDEAIEQVRSRNKIPDLATLQRAVTASGRSWKQYRTEMREQLLERQLMSAIMARGTQVTDRELDQALAREPGLIEQRKLRHLLLRLDPGAQAWEIDDAMGRAKILLERIDGGEDFLVVAKTSSEDPSAGSGGDLGWIGRGITDPAFVTNANASSFAACSVNATRKKHCAKPWFLPASAPWSKSSNRWCA